MKQHQNILLVVVVVVIVKSMLVCGEINPPPVCSEGYEGVFMSDKDDMQGKASRLKGTPLRVEHNNNILVGEVLQGWTDARGAMWALAEIDVSKPHGAMTAAAVQQGSLGGFSLGYLSKLKRDTHTGRYKAEDKRIVELSIVKKGAHNSCTIASFFDATHRKPKKVPAAAAATAAAASAAAASAEALAVAKNSSQWAATAKNISTLGFGRSI